MLDVAARRSQHAPVPTISRIAATALVLALACGPDSSESTTGGSTRDTSSPTTTTDVPTTTGTTGEPAACSGVALPHGAPSGTQAAFWAAVKSVGSPVDAAQVYLVDGSFGCNEDPPASCTADGPPQLFGYFVVLGSEQRKPGIYPVSADGLSEDAWIGALLYEWNGTGCALRLGMAAASDGEVEVLADDDRCIAIDVRGVTPTTYHGVTIDPNGSGHASKCSD
jgi:hypothetical protein